MSRVISPSIEQAENRVAVMRRNIEHLMSAIDGTERPYEVLDPYEDAVKALAILEYQEQLVRDERLRGLAIKRRPLVTPHE